MPEALVTLSPPPPGGKWRNPHRRLPAVRWAVQGLYAAFCVLVGIEFVAFYEQAAAGGPVTASRPPAVEAFLPISALLGLKRLVLTGQWDDVHPAGLAILVAALGTALVARKAFCSWVCPGGTLSRALEWLGAKVLWRRGRHPVLPRWVDLPLLSLKYVLLAFFAWIVLLQMPAPAIEGFLRSPYNMAADAKMLLFFRDPSALVAGILVALVVLSVVVKHFWCKYLCPYGALLGLVSLLSPARVRRDAAACNDCRACTRACPSAIPVHRRASVWTAECTGCMSCVAACTTPDCLTVTRRGATGLSPWLVPAAALGVMLGAWAIARATGHWETALPGEMLARVYRMAPYLGH
ncbi:MAG TPA: 4Fe-4S binding protein [Anaeromyxobacteraceae bacterium]|nr:4Fe-4S binding protein [Anaeromyxobacteraceae bacterium]